MLRLDVDPKVSLAPAAVRSALGLVETWDTTPFKAPEPVAPPVSHGSQMGDYLLFLALIASLAGAPFGLARMLDALTPGPWLLAFYYGVFGQTLYTWGSVLVRGFLAAERSRRHTPPPDTPPAPVEGARCRRLARCPLDVACYRNDSQRPTFRRVNMTQPRARHWAQQSMGQRALGRAGGGSRRVGPAAPGRAHRHAW